MRDRIGRMPPRRVIDPHVPRVDDGDRAARRVDGRVARLARRQHGMVAFRQLRRLGLSEDEIQNRVDAGRLIRVHRGVFAVGHLPSSPESRWMAAVLAVGDGAVLCDEHAAALWGMRDRAPGTVRVSSPRRQRSRRGIDVRQRSPMATTRKGIRVTTPLQTLLDLAARPLSERELSWAIHEAQVKELVTHRELLIATEANRGRRGNARLRRILALGPARTRSALEELALDFLQRHAFPRPETNVAVHGEEVDLYFRSLRLVVEIDSERYHGTLQRRRSDAEKQARLEAAGERVLRVWDFQLDRDDPLTVRRLARALAPSPPHRGFAPHVPRA